MRNRLVGIWINDNFGKFGRGLSIKKLEKLFGFSTKFSRFKKLFKILEVFKILRFS